MKRSGITLVEMLVAMAITLLLMATVVQVFSVLGAAVADSRGALEMADRLRQTRNLLQADLGGISRPVVSWVEDDSGGYFEYVEGGLQHAVNMSTPINVTDATYLGAPEYSRFGDYDDVLMFTATANDRPFQGRIVNSSGVVTPIESPSAEIVWYAVPEFGADYTEPLRVTVYRRVLLIAPWASSLITSTELQIATGTTQSAAVGRLIQFQRRHDLSARLDWANKRIVLNSINDLTLRQNRFGHDPLNFPHQLILTNSPYTLSQIPFAPLDSAVGREGEDMVLPNALALDVRIYDPGAPLYSDGSVVYGPGDPGYPGGTPTGYGAYVDLGFATTTPVAPNSLFGSTSASYGSTHALRRAYDTWPADYESDGVDQDGDGTTDEGTDGFDDGANGIDDPGERETAAPYAASPTGIQVKLRVYEPDSRQIREMTVNQHFAR